MIVKDFTRGKRKPDPTPTKLLRLQKAYVNQRANNSTRNRKVKVSLAPIRGAERDGPGSSHR